jgi:hypothetical protein
MRDRAYPDFDLGEPTEVVGAGRLVDTPGTGDMLGDGDTLEGDEEGTVSLMAT